MRIRRCALLRLESREETRFDLSALLSGDTGVLSHMRWLAHAPALQAEVEVDAAEVALLGETSPSDWVSAAPLRMRHGAARVRRLLRAGLLVGSTAAWAHWRREDERVRALHWHGAAADYHHASRWSGIDAAGEVEDAGLHNAEGLRRAYGVPPPMLHQRGDGDAVTALPPASRSAYDDLLDARASCRNFDAGRKLPLASLAQVLERAFGERGRVRGADEFDVLKRTSPSGGALHPTECYLLARRVDGLAPGLYHYLPARHALQSLPMADARILADAGKHPAARGKTALDYLAWIAVGGQQYFAEAHALCVLAPRFYRNFWKYRRHPKAYRVCILDVGHLSQTLLLSATEAGLGSFVTAAINEVDIERAFGLEPWSESPLAVCGIGPRADRMETYELDPNRRAWPR